MDETEYAVWEALEPYLETHIHLDLNDVDDSAAFREMVSRVSSAASELRSDESDRQDIATVIDNMYDNYEPVYNEDGQIISSNIADSVVTLAVGASARKWKKRAGRAESALFRVFGYFRGAAGRVFRQMGEDMGSLFEYEPAPRLYRMPYQVSVDGKVTRYRTRVEALVDVSDARNDYPNATVYLSERDAEGEWIRIH